MSGSRGEKAGEVPSEQCRLLAPSLAAFAEGALPPEEAESVAAHVAGCGWCAARMAAYAEVDALVRQAPSPTPPPSLRAGLYARIAAAQASERHRPSEVEMIVRDIDTQDVPATAAPPTAQPRRGRAVRSAARWVSVAAAALIVALMAGLFATQHRVHITVPAKQPTATATAVPQRACAPNEIQASLPARTGLGDLAMTGPSTGWAVGGVADSDIQPTSFHSLILRYANCRWEPFGDSLPNASLGNIVMVSPGEGWAAGEQANAPLLLHYKDGAWSKVTLPNLGAPYTIDAIVAMRALSNGEVWVVGRTPAGTHQSTGIAILHLSGGRWTRIETPFNEVSDIALVGPGDAWLIATRDPDHTTNGIELAHYQGGVLTKEVPLDQRDYLTNLRMLAANDGWASGFAYVSGNETTDNPTVNRPIALHYDGTSWTEVDIGARSDAIGLVVLGQGEAWSFTRTSTIPQYTNATQREHLGQWQSVAWPYKDSGDVRNLTCVTADDCWAIGSYALPDQQVGTVNVVGRQGMVLLRYADGAWHEYGRAG